MTPRERYIATLLFQSPDKIPFEPGRPRESTLRRWRAEGLPLGDDWYATLCREIGIPAESAACPLGDSLVDFKMNPKFEEKILEHRDGHYLVQDWMGNIA